MKKLLFFALFIMLVNGMNAQNMEVKSVNLSSIQNRIKAGGDTLFILNFWATWCKPCVEEMPIIDNIQINHKDKPVKVLLVSLDFPNQIKTKLIPFIQDNYIHNEVVILDESNPNYWIPSVSEDWSGAIPACWFIFKDKQLFHEGQITPNKIDHMLNSLVE